jgi:hypothetical protein
VEGVLGDAMGMNQNQDGVAFAPLIFQVSRVSEELGVRYRVFAPEGGTVTVQASSAAEAVEKSGISAPLRIISLANEQRRLMAGDVLLPREQTVATNIDLEHFVPDFRFLAEAEMQDPERPPFEEMDFSAYAARARTYSGVRILPSHALRSESPSLLAEEAEEPGKSEEAPPLPQEEPPVQEVVASPQEPHELSEEEVQALLGEEKGEG